MPGWLNYLLSSACPLSVCLRAFGGSWGPEDGVSQRGRVGLPAPQHPGPGALGNLLYPFGFDHSQLAPVTFPHTRAQKES